MGFYSKMSQEDLNCSGIYFLASRFLNGSYLYKVGKSENIAKRIKQYPQNFELILHIACSNRHISEKEVIQVVERLEDYGIIKCGQGNEFFRSEEDKIREIKFAIYEWYFVTERTRTREITREVQEETQVQSIVKSSPTLPACRKYDEILTIENGIRIWRNEDGKKHRIGGPAEELPDGSKAWLQNGKKHRIGGPAIELSNGTKIWFENDLIHRIGGPAIELPDGTRTWCENGKKITEPRLRKGRPK